MNSIGAAVIERPNRYSNWKIALLQYLEDLFTTVLDEQYSELQYLEDLLATVLERPPG